MKTIISFLIFIFMTSNALAMYPIVRSFQSVRAEGMGNVRYTTGMYEENFFANPARMGNIEEDRFQLPKISLEMGADFLNSFSSLTNADGLSAFSNNLGKPLSARFQMIFPAWYRKNFWNEKWSMGVALNTSAQVVAYATNTGQVFPGTLINIGPAFTVSRKFLEENRLMVGATAHVEMRANSTKTFSVIDFLKGKVSSALRGGSGVGIDFDVGTTYSPHWTLWGFNYTVAFAMNNLLGGTYHNLGLKLGGWNGSTTPSNRSYNFGISAERSLWFLDQLTTAFELTDIGNNTDGSLFRTIHIGAEGKWRKMSLRTGINQGYFTGGIGFDFAWFAVNAATYGEELGLNSGILEDRRYAIDFGFQI